jgi:Spy/CpxP family protein refolding chaperone
MKKTLIMFTIVAVLIGTIGYSALAFGPGQGRGRNQGEGMGMRNGRSHGLMAELNLTPEQQQKMLAIRQQFQKDTQNIRFELQKKHLDLRQLWTAKPLNQAAIERETKEMAALRVQITTKAQAMLEKMKAVLTPEQLKFFNERAIKGHGGFDGGRMHGGRGFGMNQDCQNCTAVSE